MEPRWELSNSEPWCGSAGARAAQAQRRGDELGEIVSGSLVRSAAARPSRSPGSRGAGGLCWAGGLGGTGEGGSGPGLCPLCPALPRAREAALLLGRAGSVSFLHYAAGCSLEKAPICRNCANPGQVWENLQRHALSRAARGRPPRGLAAPASLTCKSFHLTRLWECPPL